MGRERLKWYIEYIYTCTELKFQPKERKRLKRYIEYMYTECQSGPEVIKNLKPVATSFNSYLLNA
jgi:hypothetical protein